MNHCIETITTLVEQGRDDRRSILQIGYNLGRLSELTGLGREPFWDRWKGPIEAWDLDALRSLARDLPSLTTLPHHPEEIRAEPNGSGRDDPCLPRAIPPIAGRVGP